MLYYRVFKAFNESFIEWPRCENKQANSVELRATGKVVSVATGEMWHAWRTFVCYITERKMRREAKMCHKKLCPYDNRKPNRRKRPQDMQAENPNERWQFFRRANTLEKVWQTSLA